MNAKHLGIERTTLDVAITAQQDDAKRPTHRADAAGAAYASCVTDEHRKNHGLYLTPIAIANFIVGLITANGDAIRILDPAAGAGVLLCAAVETS